MRLFRKLFVTLLVAGLVGCAGVGQTTGLYVDDSTITTKVKAKLYEDPATSGWKISVITQDGVVQLAGFVKSEQEKERAAELASAVAGVKSVKNDLVVQVVQ